MNEDRNLFYSTITAAKEQYNSSRSMDNDTKREKYIKSKKQNIKEGVKFEIPVATLATLNDDGIDDVSYTCTL